MHLATLTKNAINAMLEADQGAKYRRTLGQVLPHIGDAYRDDEARHRKHLGASVLGNECMRAGWYSWRWYTVKKFNGSMIRLFNRGHLEEGRIIAQLLACGIQVFQQDANGKQFGIKNCYGHFGGSGDGVALGVPDVPVNEYCLLEFKTSNTKKFKEMVLNGVEVAKPEHYLQIQMYLHHMGLKYALYIMVCKENDEIHCEIVTYNQAAAEMGLRRATAIIWADAPPKMINSSPGWYQCKTCDHLPVCKQKVTPDVNCRTCQHAQPVLDQDGGLWRCGVQCKMLTTQEQLDACPTYKLREF